jgi:predicted SAM-dependent methyltransferase
VELFLTDHGRIWMTILRGELNRVRIIFRPAVIRRYLRDHSTPKLHLGCGKKIVPGWLNCDKFAPDADIYLNAYRKLPFASGTFHAVYMEHLIEHIHTDRVPSFLSELHRVLMPEGILRITCPDLELFVRMYYEENADFFAPILERFAARREKNLNKHWLVRTKGGAFNTRAVQRFFHHRWMYDFETLDWCLREVGFRNVIRQQYGLGLMVEVADLDTKSHQMETLYVDALK